MHTHAMHACAHSMRICATCISLLSFTIILLCAVRRGSSAHGRSRKALYSRRRISLPEDGKRSTPMNIQICPREPCNTPKHIEYMCDQRGRLARRQHPECFYASVITEWKRARIVLYMPPETAHSDAAARAHTNDDNRKHTCNHIAGLLQNVAFYTSEDKSRTGVSHPGEYAPKSTPGRTSEGAQSNFDHLTV